MTPPPNLTFQRATVEGPKVVVFSRRHAPAFRWWWRLFVGPVGVEFGHCYVLAPAKVGVVMLNAVETGAFVDWIPWPMEVCASLLVEHGAVALRVDRKGDRPYAPIELLTCVTAVKAIIGLRAPLVVTPRQLYRRLVAEGATRVAVNDGHFEGSILGSEGAGAGG